MTYEQLFAGRIELMRAQRHILQAGLKGWDHTIPVFHSKDHDDAFWIVERKLVELENEFTEKANRAPAKKRKALLAKADRQVSQ